MMEDGAMRYVCPNGCKPDGEAAVMFYRVDTVEFTVSLCAEDADDPDEFGGYDWGKSENVSATPVRCARCDALANIATEEGGQP
jgi:hypothetical protein